MPTITGTAQDITQGFFAGSIKFENLEVPVADGSRTTCSIVTEVQPNSSTGVFSVLLAPGRTRVTVSGKSKTFTVPTGSSSYNLADLLGATSSTSYPTAGDVDPTFTPTVSTQLYWNRVGRKLWIWDDGEWTQLLGL